MYWRFRVDRSRATREVFRFTSKRLFQNSEFLFKFYKLHWTISFVECYAVSERSLQGRSLPTNRTMSCQSCEVYRTEASSNFKFVVEEVLLSELVSFAPGWGCSKSTFFLAYDHTTGEILRAEYFRFNYCIQKSLRKNMRRASPPFSFHMFFG